VLAKPAERLHLTCADAEEQGEGADDAHVVVAIMLYAVAFGRSYLRLSVCASCVRFLPFEV
jgi:hypothetical protein